MPEIGDLVDGRYRLVRRIAEGGMGVVYEATHERLGKPVAIKFLLEQFAQVESSAHERFEQEARAAVAIGHRSIVDVNDYGTTDEGHPYIVMELLRGQSLATLLRQEGRIDASLTVHIMCQVLSALVYAHRMGVIHRDLKPDNVFLVASGGAMPEVKLLDFGISKVRSLEGMDTAKTKSGIVLGTPDYMSPEQARGEKDLDHRIDIYAVGAMLYECLSGHPPFQADNYNALLLQIALEEPTPLGEIDPELPKGLVRAIDKALARERDDRYSQALEMLHGLAPYADQSLLPPEVRLSPADSEPPEQMALKPTVGATPRAKLPAETGRVRAPGPGLRQALVAALAVLTLGLVVAVALRGGPGRAGEGPGAEPDRTTVGDGGSRDARPEARDEAPPLAATDAAAEPASEAEDAGAVLVALEPDGGAAEAPGSKSRRPWPPRPRTADAGAASLPAPDAGRTGRDPALERAGTDVVFQPQFD